MKHESGESALLYASANLSAKVVELEAQIAALNAKLARVRELGELIREQRKKYSLAGRGVQELLDEIVREVGQ